MPNPFDNADVIEALGQELNDETQDRPKPHHILYKEGWRPKLNPIQESAVNNSAIFKLYTGPRGTGKTVGAVNELVDACYRNDNYLAYIIARESSMASMGGAWHKLQQIVLPEWGQGIGMRYTSVSYDVNTKRPHIWISNRHGGWSMISMLSLPVAHQVEIKIKGQEPQIVLLEEGDTLPDRTYFTSIVQQLGRVPGSDDPSKLIITCNPAGPSHWLYQLFFVEPVDPETGEWDSRFAHFNFPISDNEKNLPPNYYQDYVDPALKHDPILQARLKRGEWVDRPEGNALFGTAFVPGVHIRGDATQNQGLVPIAGHPMIVSYDPGAAHSCVHFEQIIPTLDKIYKLVIDEMDYVGVYVPYRILVPRIIQRMIYWDQKMKTQFQWLHVSDDSAFNQYRAAEGSFDVWDIEKISKKHVEENKLDPRYIIRMRKAPKGEFSREARVRMVMEDLITSSLLISATCVKTKEMFEMLPEDPENRLNPKKKHRYVHDLDSLSYGFFYFSTRRIEVPGAVDTIKPMYYTLGQTA